MAAKHLGPAIDLGQVEQAAQVDAGLDRTAVQTQVEFSGLGSPGVEFLLQGLLGRGLAEAEGGQAVFGKHQQLADARNCGRGGPPLAFVQQTHLIAVGTNGERLTHERGRRRIAIAVEADAGMRADDGRHDLVRVEGQGGQRPQQGPFLWKRSMGRSWVVSWRRTLAT